MNSLFYRITTLAFLVSGVLFLSSVSADQLSLPTADLIAPTVTHEGISKEIVAGSSVQIKARVTDNVGVKNVILFFRVKGDKEYNRIPMARLGESDDFAVTISDEEVVSPGIEYYIQASDIAGNTLLHGYSFSPLSVAVAPSAAPAAAATAATAAMNSQKGINLSDDSSDDSDKLYKNKWLWIGLGVVAVGIAASQGGGSDDGGTVVKPSTGTVVVTSPNP